MFRYHYVMRGRLLAKKNRHRARIRMTPNGPRAFVGNDREYLAWARDAGAQVRIQRGAVPTIQRKVQVAIDVVVYLAKGQHLDDDNALGGPFDVLQAAGVVENDHQLRLRSFDRRRDWDDPRVEVTLTPFETVR